MERKFPESRRKAHFLMAMHEQLRRIHKAELQQVGWSKATELAKLARNRLIERKRKCVLISIGLLMEGFGLFTWF